MSEETINPQVEKLKKQIANISNSVTPQDRKDFMTEHKMSRGHISLCLSGKAGSVETLLKMLQFFSKKIAERNEIINQVENVIV